MKTTRSETYRVGLFVLVAGTLLLAIVVALLGRRWFREEKVYTAVFTESVGGLDEGAKVLYLGVPAGRVERIAFKEGEFPKIVVTLALRSDVPIKTGTVARLTISPLTGVARIELEGGSGDEDDLPEDSEIRARPSLIDQVSRTLPGILNRVPQTLEELARAAHSVEATLDETTRLRIHETLDAFAAAAGRIERAAATFDAEVARAGGRLSGFGDRLETEATATSASLQRAAAGVEEAARELRGVVGGEDVTAAAANLRAATEDLARIADRFDRAVGTIGSVVSAGGRELEAALVAVREAMRGAREVFDRLRDNPSGLLFPSKREERAIPEGEG